MSRLLSLFLLMTVGLLGASRVLAQRAPHDLGYLYLSPVPSASYVSAQTHYVLVRFENVTPAAVTNLLTSFITVKGTASGTHPGITHLATDGRTIIFEMGMDFSTNELVTVTLDPQVEPSAVGIIQPYQYQFMVEAPMPGSLGTLPAPAKLPSRPLITPVKPKMVAPTTPSEGKQRVTPKAMLLNNGVSVPSDFPHAIITVNNNPSPGYLFLENILSGVSPYGMMLDNNGLPVWYHRGHIADFKIQKNGMITWCLGDDIGFPAYDQSFNYLKTYVTTNGYLTDGHELKILPDGTYFMIGYHNSPVDESRYFAGGNPNTYVRENSIQEFTAAGELIFQWRGWDNYNLRDLPVGYQTDFPHMNGIDIDEDGNILVSTRSLSEVTKLNRDSGEIMWRLSGVHSTFTFIDDPLGGTSFQHNISALGNGHYMVFDDGDAHFPPVSRAVEYQLNLTNLTAKMAWQFRDSPDKYAFYLGSAQRLTSGNTLINFVMAQYPKATEVDTNGVKRFELSLVPGSDAYRAFRFPWNGAAAAPYLIAEPEPGNITLIFNKFGDTNVAFYRIYGGPSSQPATVLAESKSTLQRLSNLPNGLYYFRVTAVTKNGVESPFSNQESVDVNITQPGQNMVQNGQFSSGFRPWTLTMNGGASAGWSIENSSSHVSITSGGTVLSSIQFLQANMTLVNGNNYVLEFDAWSSQSRYIQAMIGGGGPPLVDYSNLGPSFLTPNRNHYQYKFTMRSPSDFSATLLFDLGASTADVYLANVSLVSPRVGDLNLDGRVDLLDLSIFVSSWLKQQSGLPADLDGDGKVDFNDFEVLGEAWSLTAP